MRMARTLLMAVAMSGLLAACASSPFTSTWSAPGATPLQARGAKVAAVVIARDESTRRNGEVALARELTELGAVGLPLHEIAPGIPPDDEARIRAAVEAAGVSAIVVMRPTRVDKEISSTPGMYAGGPYSGYWGGGGYYGYGWSSAPEINTDTVVSVETLVYSLPQNKLVWAGQSRTTNPSNVDGLVKTLSRQSVAEMQKVGLLSK